MTQRENGVEVPMIEQPATELAVHRLLLHGLTQLTPDQDEVWSHGVDQLCAELLHLADDVRRTLVAFVRASAVIQEFLLEAFLPLPADRQPVIDMATWLLDNLYNEDRTAQPSRPVPALITR